jgi:hypothetical protein
MNSIHYIFTIFLNIYHILNILHRLFGMQRTSAQSLSYRSPQNSPLHSCIFLRIPFSIDVEVFSLHSSVVNLLFNKTPWRTYLNLSSISQSDFIALSNQYFIL